MPHTTRQKLGVAAATLALLLALPVLLLCCAVALPPQYDATFMGELKYKYQRLCDTPGQRLVVVGGSAAAFGLDSALLEQQLPGYSAVNLGMYAALGTTVMLDISRDAVRAGDIVILTPEQQAQTLSTYFDGATLWQGLDGAFALLRHIDPSRYGALVGTFPNFAASKLRYALAGEPPAPQGVYRRASFNEYGDIAAPDCVQNVLPGGYDANTPVDFTLPLDTAFIAAVNAWADELTARGAEVYYHFSPMNALAVDADAAQIAAYYDALQAALHCRILGDPAASVMDPVWFYDSNFHLNASGRVYNTRQWVRDIKALKGITTPTTIALPAPPGQAEIQTVQGDDRDADCFTYTAQNGGLIITGLSQSGAVRTELLLPTHHDGQPVTALGRAFVGNMVVRQITLQPNIATIADGAFEGAAALQSITLQSADPAACLVGQQLLKGTEARVVVPAAALDAYKLNYFWSLYAARLVSVPKN